MENELESCLPEAGMAIEAFGAACGRLVRPPVNSASLSMAIRGNASVSPEVRGKYPAAPHSLVRSRARALRLENQLRIPKAIFLRLSSYFLAQCRSGILREEFAINRADDSDSDLPHPSTFRDQRVRLE